MKKFIEIQVSTDVTIKTAFEQCLRVKKNKNLSEETITYYMVIMKIFTRFFDETHYCSSITPDVVEDYITYLRERKTSSVTINSYLRGLRAVLYFFMERDYMPNFKISLIKQEKEIKRTYTNAELELLLKKPDMKKCNFTEYRNWALSNYLLATGNRLSTVCNLKIDDIDFQNQQISLRKVKNRKQYLIPLSTTLARILQDYLLYRKGEPEDYLFCNKFGEKMDKEAISSAIRRYNE